MNEPFLTIAPHGGRNIRFPEHKIVSAKGVQKVRNLDNMMSLDGKIFIVPGATRFDANSKPGVCTWLKRIYYEDGFDNKKYLFAIIGNLIYKGNESTQTLNQVNINGQSIISLTAGFYPISTTIKSNQALATYLVDGSYFYKFLPNEDGEWERLPDINDIDGNKINPIFTAEWLDRQWVLVKGQNILLGSANRQPEIFNDATDSILIELPPGNGGYPRALIKYQGVLHVFHDDYFVPVTGSSASTFGVRPGDVAEGYGTHAPRSVILVKGKIGFLNSKDNEYYLTQGTFDSTGDGVVAGIPLSYEIRLRDLINPIHTGDTVCHFDTVQNLLRIAYFPSGGQYLGDEEIFSISENKWCGSTRGRNISGYTQWNGLDDDGRLSTGRSDVGAVVTNDNSINFDGAAIHYKFVSASYMAKDPFDVQFEEFYIEALPQANTNIDVSYYIDTRLTTVGQEGVNTQGEIISLGQIQIDDQKVFVNRFIPFIDRSKGRMIRFQIEGQKLNQLLEFYTIYAFFNVQESKFSKYIGGQ